MWGGSIVNGTLIDGQKCSGDVIIPSGVTNISKRAFYYCQNITSITIPNSVTSIGNSANAEIICMSGCVDLILMDICTADNESGLKAAMKIKRLYSDINIILMTSMPEHSFLTRAWNGGIDSFWYKEYGDVDLLEICKRTAAGQRVYPVERPNIKMGLSESALFTDREFEIIRELAIGNKYGEIAEHLEISENTVKYHVKNIMSKTGCKNTVALVAEVVEKRLVLPKY